MRHGLPGPRRIGVVAAAASVLTAAAVLTVGNLDRNSGQNANLAGPLAQSGPHWANPTDDGAPVAKPVRLRIPAIGVDGPVVDIGVDAAGVLVPPPTADQVGWFTGGPAPGDTGPALLAAHVDSRAGPGVFFRLIDLRAGDRISVERADQTSVVFTVVSTSRVPKSAFPTELVYAPLPVPMLRLITCGGTFDRAAHSYRDNVIVEAAPTP